MELDGVSGSETTTVEQNDNGYVGTLHLHQRPDNLNVPAVPPMVPAEEMTEMNQMCADMSMALSAESLSRENAIARDEEYRGFVSKFAYRMRKKELMQQERLMEVAEGQEVLNKKKTLLEAKCDMDGKRLLLDHQRLQYVVLQHAVDEAIRRRQYRRAIFTKKKINMKRY